jgi:hypothetical protein
VHVVIAVCQQRVAQRSEHSRFVTAEVIVEDEVQSLSRLRLVLIVPIWTVPTSAVFDLFYGETEPEKIFLPSLLHHFDGRPIARSHRQGSVHHELHVARSTVARWNQPFSERNIVLWQKNHLEPAAYGGITVNCSCKIVDELDD